MFEADELKQWLSKVSQHLTRPISVYMIGGGALCFRELKRQTKDIDIIIKSKTDFNVLNKAILDAGYSLETDLKDEFYLTALAVYLKEDSRIDVFLKHVGKMLILTPSMIKRAEHFREYGKLKVNLVSNEDIFLFKAMTTRKGDIYDCEALIRQGIIYDTVYNEVVEQSTVENKWFFWLYEKLCQIEDVTGLETPLKPRVLSLVKEHWDDRPRDWLHMVSDLSKHLPKELLKKG